MGILLLRRNCCAKSARHDSRFGVTTRARHGPGGFVISVFGDGDVSDALIESAADRGVAVQRDRPTPDRIAIPRCADKAAALRVRDRILEAGLSA